MMEKSKKEKRYERLFGQISDLLKDKDYPLARMATIVAVLLLSMKQMPAGWKKLLTLCNLK